METLTHVAIYIECGAEHADVLTSQCSRLFHNHLLKIVDKIINEVHRKYLLPQEISRLSIDIGEIALTGFETQFCRRVHFHHSLLLSQILRCASRCGVRWLIRYAA